MLWPSGATVNSKEFTTGEALFDVHVGVSISVPAQWNYFNSLGFPADQIEIENLRSTKQERQQIAIMGVAWVCQLKIGTDRAAQLMQIVQDSTFVSPQTITNGAVDGDPDTDPVTVSQ